MTPARAAGAAACEPWARRHRPPVCYSPVAPLAEAVIFAMLASYLLSRTLVPTMARYLLHGHEHECGHGPRPSRNPLVRMQRRFEHGFERLRAATGVCWNLACTTAARSSRSCSGSAWRR